MKNAHELGPNINSRNVPVAGSFPVIALFIVWAPRNSIWRTNDLTQSRACQRADRANHLRLCEATAQRAKDLYENTSPEWRREMFKYTKKAERWTEGLGLISVSQRLYVIRYLTKLDSRTGFSTKFCRAILALTLVTSISLLISRPYRVPKNA